MKQLSIEEKAKAYDSNYKAYIELINRLENVKDAIKKQNYGIAMDILCKPYPEFQVTTHSELKESEGERIGKELLNAFQESEDSLYMVLTPHRRESFIAWLERQGNLMKALQISNAKIGELIEKNYYLKEQFEKQGNNMGIPEATKQELENNLNKALEKETPESCNEFLEKQGWQPKKHDACNNCDQQGSCVSPCPMKLVEKQGEQKTTIEMITPEESLGVDSDTYNKIVDECIYGEQKPAWSEEDIELLNNTIKFIEDRVAATSPSLRTYSPTLTGKEIPFLKALKDRVQPKQEWSDVDKDILFRTIDNLKFLRDTVSIDPKYAINIIDIEREITWLNSLRPQYKYSYNPYKAVVESIAEMCKHYDKASHSGLRDFYDNVKVKCNDAKEYDSLFPQSQWKPSDEQMNSLKQAISTFPYETDYLELLYDDLKKLREE